MSNAEHKQMVEKITRGLEIAEREMLEEKAKNNEDVIVCGDDNVIRRNNLIFQPIYLLIILLLSPLYNAKFVTVSTDLWEPHIHHPLAYMRHPRLSAPGGMTEPSRRSFPQSCS